MGWIERPRAHTQVPTAAWARGVCSWWPTGVGCTRQTRVREVGAADWMTGCSMFGDAFACWLLRSSRQNSIPVVGLMKAHSPTRLRQRRGSAGGSSGASYWRDLGSRGTVAGMPQRAPKRHLNAGQYSAVTEPICHSLEAEIEILKPQSYLSVP